MHTFQVPAGSETQKPSDAAILITAAYYRSTGSSAMSPANMSVYNPI